MIYLRLFLEFLKIGLFSFGGAYAAIPLIQDVVLENGWMDSEMISNMIAISESTPGPIMVNAATYVGSTQAGALGALAATIGVVLPAFLIVILLVNLFQKLMQNRTAQLVLAGVKPCIMGIIIATGLHMLVSNLFLTGQDGIIDHGVLCILIVLLLINGVFHRQKKAVSPIAFILVSAVLGVICF